MADDWKYGHTPPKNDDGSYKQVAGRFGFWILYADGTFKNLATGTTHDPADIGSGGSGSSYTDEQAQDAVGTNYDTTLAYDDAAPSFGVADAGIDTTQIATDAVTAAKIASGAVDTTQLATDAVTNAKVANNAVDSAEIVDDAVTAAKIAAGAVGSTQLDNEAVQDVAGGLASSYLTYDDANDALDFDEIQHLVDHPDRAGVKLLEDTESYDISVPVPDGETLEVYRWGVWKVADYTAPAGLQVQLLDDSDTTQASANTTNNQATGSPVASLANSSGSASLYKLRITNGTGGALTTDGVDGHFGYRVVA